MELKVKSIKIKDSNHLAKLVTELEGGAVNLTIAQVKDVINAILTLQSFNFSAVQKVMRKTAADLKVKRKKAKK